MLFVSSASRSPLHYPAEEFNSILEQMPELARQIAAGMGVSIGELRQLMLDGN